MDHQLNKSGEAVHTWKIGVDITKSDDPDDDGFFSGTCLCGAVRFWPAVIIDEKLIASKKKITSLAPLDDSYG